LGEAGRAVGRKKGEHASSPHVQRAIYDDRLVPESDTHSMFEVVESAQISLSKVEAKEGSLCGRVNGVQQLEERDLPFTVDESCIRGQRVCAGKHVFPDHAKTLPETLHAFQGVMDLDFDIPTRGFEFGSGNLSPVAFGIHRSTPPVPQRKADHNPGGIAIGGRRRNRLSLRACG
jgi:hypothetical protein